MAASRTRVAESPTTTTRDVDGEESVQRLFAVLEDEDCRTILDATSDAALSASELSEACDLPLSTAYRKLDRLTSAGLVDEGTRIRRCGTHTSEYSRAVSDLVVSFGPHGDLEVAVTRRETGEPAGASASGTAE